MRRTLGTDFETLGLSRGAVSVEGRSSVVTIDFEAFTPETAPAWIEALDAWTDMARASGLKSCLFVSVEDTAALRVNAPRAYANLCDGLQALTAAGGELHPHNHCVFDAVTAEKLSSWTGWPQQAPGYRRRTSMYYDTVYRHGLAWSDWLEAVLDAYRQLLEDAAIDPPPRIAFRAGGWDYGSTREDAEDYLASLSNAGIAIDSSATAGRYGGPEWRIGDRFGANLYHLTPRLIEVAPCWSLNVGGSRPFRSSLGSFARLARAVDIWRQRQRAGVFVTVLHFDHLVLRGIPWVGRVARTLSVLERSLKLQNETFSSLELS